jgi:hypothetical protein
VEVPGVVVAVVVVVVTVIACKDDVVVVYPSESEMSPESQRWILTVVAYGTAPLTRIPIWLPVVYVVMYPPAGLR